MDVNEEEYFADNPDGEGGDGSSPERPGTPVNKRRKRNELSSAEKKAASKGNSSKTFQHE